MPYVVRKVGTEFCVQKADGGRTLGCHATREAAQKQIFAINVSEGRVPGVKPHKTKGSR